MAAYSSSEGTENPATHQEYLNDLPTQEAAEKVFDCLSQIGSKAVVEVAIPMHRKLAQVLQDFDAHPSPALCKVSSSIRPLQRELLSIVISERKRVKDFVCHVDSLIDALEKRDDDCIVQKPLNKMLEEFIESTDKFEERVKEFQSLQVEIKQCIEQPPGCNDEAKYRIVTWDNVGNLGMTAGGSMVVGAAVILGAVSVSSGPVGWVAGAAVSTGVAGLVGVVGGAYIKKGDFDEKSCSTFHGDMNLGEHVDGQAKKVPEIIKEIKRMGKIVMVAKYLKGGDNETITSRLRKLKDDLLKGEFRELESECVTFFREKVPLKDDEQTRLLAEEVP